MAATVIAIIGMMAGLALVISETLLKPETDKSDK